MANTNEKLKRLQEIHKREEALYAERNEKYGDSFAKTFEKRGPAVALIRLEDKLNRADYLLTHGIGESDGESVIDTLMDLSNYANMTILELMKAEATKAPTKPEKPASKKRKKKAREEAPQEKGEAPAKDKGPLDDLTKKELTQVIEQLGGTIPKKANREKLTSIIEGYPKAKVAVAITSLKAEAPATTEEEEDGEEE